MSELNTLQFNYQVHINAHTTSPSSSAVLRDLQTICVVSVDLCLSSSAVEIVVKKYSSLRGKDRGMGNVNFMKKEKS